MAIAIDPLFETLRLTVRFPFNVRVPLDTVSVLIPPFSDTDPVVVIAFATGFATVIPFTPPLIVALPVTLSVGIVLRPPLFVIIPEATETLSPPPLVYPAKMKVYAPTAIVELLVTAVLTVSVPPKAKAPELFNPAKVKAAGIAA